MGMLARAFEHVCDFIFPRADTARRVAATSSVEFAALLAPHITEIGTTVLLPYRHSLVRAVILEAKFHRNHKAFVLLGDVLADYVASLSEEMNGFEESSICIVTVPLGPSRRRARGYNQVEEVVKCTNVQFDTSFLHRTRDTVAQTSLTRAARLSNMKDAFEALGPFEPSVTYIVLDDVMTTGTTLASAAAALRAAGAMRVISLALAH